MDDSPEVIRQRMEETRASLSEKLETLEQEVVGRVQDARAAVTDTVETVKEAVQETVDSVKDTFNINRHIQRHPWAVFGGSIALGFIGGRLLEQLDSKNGNGPPAPVYDRPPATNGDTLSGQPYGSTGTAGGPAAESEKVAGVHSLLGRVEPEVDKLKGLAVGTVMALVRDMLTGSIPDPLKPQVSEVMNSLTVKLGGQPIHGQIVQPT